MRVHRKTSTGGVGASYRLAWYMWKQPAGAMCLADLVVDDALKPGKRSSFCRRPLCREALGESVVHHINSFPIFP